MININNYYISTEITSKTERRVLTEQERLQNSKYMLNYMVQNWIFPTAGSIHTLYNQKTSECPEDYLPIYRLCYHYYGNAFTVYFQVGSRLIGIDIQVDD